MAAAMYRRLAKELPALRSKTLQQDGLAMEDGSEEQSFGSRAGPPGGSPQSGTRFVALLAGPRGSPYEGGVFRLQVEVPPGYPMEPPKMKFNTRIFHPNVGRGHTPGAICLDILRKEAWSPALTLERMLLSIASLLADPNPASPMDGEAAKLYTTNRPAYDRRVQEWVRQHAMPSSGAVNSETPAWEGCMGKAHEEEEEDDEAQARSAMAESGVDQSLPAPSPVAALPAATVPAPSPKRQRLQRSPSPVAAGSPADDGLPEWARPVVIDLDLDDD